MSASKTTTLCSIILQFGSINLLTAVSKFYMKPISTFYRQQELTAKQISTT